MITSMTGFASCTIIIEQCSGQSPLHLTISLKSLNSRFFEITCKIPPALTALEIEIIKKIKQQLYRGQVYLTIHLHNPNSLISEVTADTQTVAGYLNAINQIQQSTDLHNDLSLGQILRLPHVFSFKEVEPDQNVKAQTLDTIDALTNDLIAARLQEGQELEQDLRLRLKNMDLIMQQVVVQADRNIANKKAEVVAKIEQLAKDIQDATLLENQKIFLYNSLDKLDVHEEITRFCSHLKKLYTILDSAEIEKGKSLDFTIQECNREINTIAAKANCLEINTLAIEIKIEIEKVRQQVQNII